MSNYHYKYYKSGIIGIILFLIYWILEIIINLPRIFLARRWYKKQFINSKEPRVLLVGDFFDELNGVSLHSRILVKNLIAQNHTAYLLGLPRYQKKPHLEAKNILLAPMKGSINVDSYQGFQIGFPNIRFFIKLV